MSLRPLIWSLFLWALLFSYSWLNYVDASVIWISVPIVANIISCIILAVIYSSDTRNTKANLVALSWSMVVSVGVLLHTIDIIDDIALNIHIAVMSVIIASVWCITSHAEHVTEGGLHWYIWSMLMIFALCSVFNREHKHSANIYLFAVIVSFMSHVYYIWHIFRIQSSGRARCRHIFRVVSCLVLFSTFLVSSILTVSEEISEKIRQEIILGIEFVLAAIIIVDWVLGFSDNSIKYNVVGNEFADVA